MTNSQRAALLYTASEECLHHATESFKRNSWNMCIRRSQEAVELMLTGILAQIGIHFPKDHDQAPLLFRVLKANGIDIGHDAEKIERISIDLSRKRGPALHQEEGYDKETANKALMDAMYVIRTTQYISKDLLK